MGSPARFMGHSGIWRRNGDLSVMSTGLRRDCLSFARLQHPKVHSGARTGLGIVADHRDLAVLLHVPGDGHWRWRQNVLLC